jgi:hypothetical protein
MTGVGTGCPGQLMLFLIKIMLTAARQRSACADVCILLTNVIRYFYDRFRYRVYS